MIRSLIRCLFLLPILILICACGSKSNETMKSKTIAGIAQNGKGGAVVVMDDGGVYYLEEVDEWESDLIGKRIEVTGILKIESFSEGDLQNERGEYTQGVAGEKKILVNAKWKLLED